MTNRKQDFDPEERELRDRLRAAASPGCPHPALIGACLEEALPAGQTDTIRKHVDSCAACRALASAMRGTGWPEVDKAQVARVLKRVRQQTGSAPARRFWPFRFAVAAAACAALVAVGFLLRRGPAGPQTAPPRVELASLAPLEKPPVTLPLKAVVVFRGGGADSRTAYLHLLAEALAPYEAGDYTKAAEALTALAGKNPSQPEAQFYLGVTLLLLNRPADAVAPLTAASAAGPEPFRRQAWWYLGVAHLRREDAASARAAFASLCASAGERQSDACAVAARIPSAPR